MYKKYEKYYNVISSKKKKSSYSAFSKERKRRVKIWRVTGERAREKIVDSKLGEEGRRENFPARTKSKISVARGRRVTQRNNNSGTMCPGR